MKIIFDLRRVGLGDNGGSSTIINSANMLVDLGHVVYIADNGKNYHTWTPLRAEHTTGKVPDADFIIATGYKSVGTTINAPSRCGIKLHWIRGWETWQMDERDIVKKVLEAPTIKLVNGIGLQKKLQQYHYESYIVRPGYDIDNFKPLGIREKNKKVVIGGLYNEGRGKQNKRTPWLYETAFKIKTHRRDVEFWLFGTHPKPKRFLMDNYIQKPSLKEKNEFYNHINIWLAPTALEGLHIPPAEAMLTECPVIGTNSKMNGMHDYLTHMKTGIVCLNKLDLFIGATSNLIDDRELQIRLGKKARESILELGSRKDNMIKFVELLKRLKNENI
jgi:glycosyltransferase involved in cell wall biosynthesis